MREPAVPRRSPIGGWIARSFLVLLGAVILGGRFAGAQAPSDLAAAMVKARLPRPWLK